MEYVTVVDESDQPLAKKVRSSVSDTDIIRVATLWVEDGRGNVLMQQRSHTKKLGAGQWQLAVAGTVGASESYLENITREAEEEIRLSGITFHEVTKRCISYPDENFPRMIMFYSAICDLPIEAFRPEEGEVEALRWVEKNELLDDVDQHPDTYVSSAKVWRSIYGS